jgi:hypothetical protein
MLKSLGAATVGVALAGCSDDGSGDDGYGNGDGNGTDEPTATNGTETDGQGAAAVAEASFAASLSDDGSIPGHDDSGSEGTGEARFDGTAEGDIEFEVTWENLEGDVTGIHIHGDGSADGGYLVRLFEPSDSEHADGAVLTGDLKAASGGSISGTFTDEDVNPSGDFDGDIETTAALVAELESPELGESGGVVNIHTEHDPDSELAGQVEAQ